MLSRKSDEPSPDRSARANRQRLAQVEGARAMANVERDAIAVRKNMDRLRALREAREAEEASAPTIVPDPPKKKRKKAVSKERRIIA
jgi:hypothetical protein